MKKRILGFVSAALCAVLLAGRASGTGSISSAVESTPGAGKGQKLSVYTSFYTMQDLAERIGEDKMTVANLVPPGTEPHSQEPQPNNIVGLENANVFIYNGTRMEHQTDNVLDSLRSDKLVAIEASSGISPLEGASECEDEGSPAGEGTEEEESSTSSHVWLSPLDAKKEMEDAKNAFMQTDPTNREAYEVSYSKYMARADELGSQLRKMTGELKNKDLIVAHQAFSHLCKEYGLDQIVIEGLSVDSKPDAARMAEIIEFAKGHGITAIFFEELVSPEVAQAVAKVIGVRIAMLDPVEGLNDESEAKGLGYFSIMEKNPEAIREANGGWLTAEPGGKPIEKGEQNGHDS